MLGAAEFLDNVGALLQESTVESYAPKVQDWYDYNRLGGFDAAEVVDAKVCAFAGWIGWGRGEKNTTDKQFNAWTSALNGHFDAKYQIRPFNTHYVRRLKGRYKEAQLARTMALLPVDALEPKEARIAVPPSGVQLLLWQLHRASGVELFRLLSMTATLLFLSRPATVWAFEPGDYDVLATPAGGVYIVCVSRSVKRHPEYVANPDRREIEVPLGDGAHPLVILAFALLRARRCSPTWERQLQLESPLQRHGAARMSAWLRTACPPKLLALPAGRRLSAYSLRIAGVSAMRVALHVEPDFVKRWGLWTSPSMVECYTDGTYGRGVILVQLFGWATARQFSDTGAETAGALCGGAAWALGRLREGQTTAAARLPPATTTTRVVLAPPAYAMLPAAAGRLARRRRLLRR